MNNPGERARRGLRWVSALFVWSALLGCGQNGQDSAYVTGVVQMDGLPLAGARVEFSPTTGSRAAFGETDINGRYELRSTRENSRVPPGSYIVRITTYKPTDDQHSGSTEKVPVQYNRDTTLQADINSGHNEKNFEITGNGKIVTP